MGNRLQRGRAYARKGQVMSLEVVAGSVTAQVQGSRARPYRVRIGIAAFGKAEWSQVQEILAGDAWYAASLLSGEMPEDVEEVFSGLGLSLFPASVREFSLDCSCPDSAVPCKHVAATFYLLAEAFDEDPFTIFAWRGRERDELLANLEVATDEAATGPGPAGPSLDDDLPSYFVRPVVARVSTPPGTSPTALLEQLPEIPVAVRGRSLIELLEPAYVTLGAVDDATHEQPAD